MEKTSTVAMVTATNIPIVFLLQTIFVTRPEPLQWVGACLVFGAIIATNLDLARIMKKLHQKKREPEEVLKNQQNIDVESVEISEHSSQN